MNDFMKHVFNSQDLSFTGTTRYFGDAKNFKLEQNQIFVVLLN